MPPKHTSTTDADRPLRLRVRPDLVAAAQVHGGEVVWIVKDPVAFQFTAFGSEEHALLQLLDGRRSPQAICREFERLFVPQRLKLAHLGAFVARMHALGLVQSDAPGQGTQVAERAQRKQRWLTASSLMSVLAIRFRGVDADRFLGWLEERTRWAFRRGTWLACLCVMIGALLLLLSGDGRGMDWSQLLSRDNLPWLMVALGGAKILHELAHGVACKHFGGECHEIGAMLLCFVPCLYCNVSDAWMIPDKWRRIAVSAAGMAIELVLAAGCVFIWRFTEPGLVNQLAINLVLLCSVNALLLNGNPLLRYDGYYILSDLWGIPNLAEQSRRALWNAAQRIVGIEPQAPDVRADRRPLLIAYAIASGAYRVLVLAGILWMLHRVLAPLGFESIAIVLSVLVVAGAMAPVVISTGRRLRQRGAARSINRRRLLPALIFAGLLLAGLLLVPVPQHARAPFVIEPSDAAPVFASTTGRLIDAVECGSSVQAGAVLVRMENIDLELRNAELTGRAERQRARIAALEARRDLDPTAGPELPEARQTLTALEQQLAVLHRQQSKLTLTAPTAGVVLPPPAVETTDSEGEPPLVSPIDAEQRGRAIPAGTLLCLIDRSGARHATLLVDEDAVAQLQSGQSVTLQADAAPLQRPSGRIDRISRSHAAGRDENSNSWSRLLREELARRDSPHPHTYYEVRVRLDQPEPRLRVGGQGAAVVTVSSESLGVRLYRALRRLFGLRV